jgi:hypothetical protein
MRSYDVVAIGALLAIGFAIMVSIPSVRAELRHDRIQMHEHQPGIISVPMRERGKLPD